MQKYLDFATKTAALAGEKLLEHFGKNDTTVRNTPKEVKSFFDELADKIIKNEIEARFPSHSYLTEETGLIDKNSDYLWIIDPLDGTGNFVNSNPFFAVSVSLWYKSEPLISVIEAPALNERYTAMKERGAYVEKTAGKTKTPASVSQIKELEKAYLVYCDGGSKTPEERKNILSATENLYCKAKDMRKLGSAALELAWVGIGRAEAYVTFKISLWDIAAGIQFVHEAGGKILDFRLKPYQWRDFAKKTGESRRESSDADFYTIDLVTTNGNMNMPKIAYRTTRQ